MRLKVFDKLWQEIHGQKPVEKPVDCVHNLLYRIVIMGLWKPYTGKIYGENQTFLRHFENKIPIVKDLLHQNLWIAFLCAIW